ncbi:hypothetical protein BDR26DRAFT_863642 [Obelidium mucronatum]|nr:hypothetical protein BDR26DRAFT_863642 [Obelidium mucronatum]
MDLLDLTTIPNELITRIFAWIHPVKVFKFRRLSKHLNNLLISSHFAVLNLETLDPAAKGLPKAPTPPIDAYWESGDDDDDDGYDRPISSSDRIFMTAPPKFQLVYANRYLKECCEIRWSLEKSALPSHYGVQYHIPVALCVALKDSIDELMLEGVTGSIPPEIGILHLLQHLDLHKNNLKGGIPSVQFLMNSGTLFPCNMRI